MQTWVWHKPSWRGSPLPHQRAARTYKELGIQSPGGHKQNLVCNRTQEKGAVTHQETDPDLPVSVRSLQQRHGLVVTCCRVQGTECSSACMGPFEGGRHYLHYLHHSLASGQTTGREHSPSTENWIKDLVSMTPPIRTRSSFPHSQSLPSGRCLHKPLSLLH